MSDTRIIVDTSKIRLFEKKLKSINSSAFPVAVRQTLNEIAYLWKTKELEKQANKKFIRREKKFFKIATHYDKSQNTKDVDKMFSRVGFDTVQGAKTEAGRKAIKNLEYQDRGGVIPQLKYIGLKQARYGNSWRKLVMARNRIGIIKERNSDFIEAEKQSKAKNKKQAFIIAARKASKLPAGRNYFLGNKTGGKQYLFRVDDFAARKFTPLFSVKEFQNGKRERTNFNTNAINIVSRKREEIFYKYYLQRLKKYGLAG